MPMGKGYGKKMGKKKPLKKRKSVKVRRRR
jgi:hypothetical protein